MQSKRHKIFTELIKTVLKSSFLWPVFTVFLAIGSALFTSAQVAVFADFTDAAIEVVRSGTVSGNTILEKIWKPVGALQALYEKFMELATGHTAVLVTHRLGSAKLADRILVMDEGRLAAAGTHEELMENCALYRGMYESQAGWYV